MTAASHSRGKRTGLWLSLTAGLGISGLLCLAIFTTAAAVLGANLIGCQDAPATTSVQTGPEPSAYALQSLPPERLSLYEHAGERFDIDWTFLASIGTQECASGNCTDTNSSGCAGPMQIAYAPETPCSPGPGPTLWERYAVSTHPGQPANVNDPADAIYTAARILRQAKDAPPTGGTYTQYHQAACNYYGACANAAASYANQVMARAVQYGFTGQGTPPAANPPLAQPPSTPPEQCNPSVLTREAASGPAIVRIAESQIGQSEHPPSSNCTIYGPCEEWCSLFVAWVWQHAGVQLPGSTTLYGYSGSLYTWVQEHHGQVLPPVARPSPGDAVFFGSGPKNSVHVGIVAQVLTDGRITTIDGNDTNNEVGKAGPLLPSEATARGAHIYGYAQPPATTPRKGEHGGPN
jgi:hypothetical protein